jgi:hypothetical protein
MTKLPGVIAAAAIGEPNAVIHFLSGMKGLDKLAPGPTDGGSACGSTGHDGSGSIKDAQ